MLGGGMSLGRRHDEVQKTIRLQEEARGTTRRPEEWMILHPGETGGTIFREGVNCLLDGVSEKSVHLEDMKALFGIVLLFVYVTNRHLNVAGATIPRHGGDVMMIRLPTGATIIDTVDLDQTHETGMRGGDECCSLT